MCGVSAGNSFFQGAKVRHVFDDRNRSYVATADAVEWAILMRYIWCVCHARARCALHESCENNQGAVRLAKNTV